jgi:hypothetical protein
MHSNIQTQENHGVALGHIGWKYYNTIKKKAMEQEFSWSGLFLSLSIAFFIVIFAALMLSFFYQSLQKADLGLLDQNIINSNENIKIEPVNTENYYDQVEERRGSFVMFV